MKHTRRMADYPHPADLDALDYRPGGIATPIEALHGPAMPRREHRMHAVLEDCERVLAAVLQPEGFGPLDAEVTLATVRHCVREGRDRLNPPAMPPEMRATLARLFAGPLIDWAQRHADEMRGALVRDELELAELDAILAGIGGPGR